LKRLIILAGKLHPYGGIETHVFHFCREMAVRSVEIILVITSKAYHSESRRALQASGVKVVEFDCSRGLNGAAQYGSCLLLLRAERGAQNVLYSHGASGFARIASRALGPALWVHHHHGDALPGRVREFPALYRQVLRRADWMITCTMGHAAVLDKAFSRGSRTVFLPYCKHEPEGSGGARHPSRNGKLVAGFFGRLRESKGVRTLFELAGWFREQGMECRLHGDDCEGLATGQLPQGVTWMGPYDSARDMDRLLASVDMMVLPTTFPEGLPLVLSEAISRGVPVVAYPGGGLREMEGFHPGVLIVPPNPDALKRGLVQMRARLADPVLGPSLAAKYRAELGNQRTVDWWVNTLSG
jgi:glycosyltransferase involved in cell wall biosynthesis